VKTKRGRSIRVNFSKGRDYWDADRELRALVKPKPPFGLETNAVWSIIREANRKRGVKNTKEAAKQHRGDGDKQRDRVKRAVIAILAKPKLREGRLTHSKLARLIHIHKQGGPNDDHVHLSIVRILFYLRKPEIRKLYAA
jgi:hypothetical protein